MVERNLNTRLYRYSHNGQEKTDELNLEGNHNTAKYWEYSARIQLRWNPDPVVKPWQSPYVCFSGNPIWKLDPNGDDDYYNYAGKYVGSDNAKTTNIRLVTSKQAFEDYHNQGLEVLQGRTRIVTLQENPDQVINDIYTSSVKNKIEGKAYIILDTKTATLNIELQPKDPQDTESSSVNKFKRLSRGGDGYISPSDDDGNKVIVGQIHGHPGAELGKTVIPGTSTADQNSAKNMGVPVYAIDKESIYKADLHGDMPDAWCKDECAPILRDALETSGGKPKK